jgi:hypothetical protein
LCEEPMVYEWLSKNFDYMRPVEIWCILVTCKSFRNTESPQYEMI